MAYATTIHAAITPRTGAPYHRSFCLTSECQSQRDLVSRVYGHKAFTDAEHNENGVFVPADALVRVSLDAAVRTANGIELPESVYDAVSNAVDALTGALYEGSQILAFVSVE